MKKNIVERFVNEFNLDKAGFYDITPFSDGSLGFSAKKNFNKDDAGRATQLSVYVHDGNPSSAKSNKKSLIVHATYGTIVENGIRIRSNYKYSDPVDLESVDEYYYNIKTKEFYKKNKKTNAEKIVNQIYASHLKPTKFFKGFWLRLKIFFWRKFLILILKFVAKLCSFVLLIISGDKYLYEPFSEEGTLNGKVIESRFRPPLKKDEKLTEDFEKSPKIDFFSYKVKHWPIIVYSIVHALGYSIFMFKNYKPVFLTTLFKNNFLTLIYVILSLWIIETIVPKLLMYLVKIFSRLASRSQYKKISI